MNQQVLKLSITLCLHTTLATCVSGYATAQSATEDSDDSATQLKRSIVRIVIQPKTSRPFNWQRGEQITLGARLISDDECRVIGVATELELVATKTFRNRVEVILRLTTDQRKRVLRAAKISELWFEAMPFHHDHIATMKKDVDFVQYLDENPRYRPANEGDWGLGASISMAAPTANELSSLRRTEQQ
ncbi:MAG: hypothetical protein HKN47_16365 [Pirellulaceae bacterium]|nr:hypothetical protein [Pirellulaceae bacterium]